MTTSFVRQTGLLFIFVVGLGLTLISGCHSSSASGGSSSGGKADQAQGAGNGQQSSGQKQGANPAGNLTEPQYTVNGSSDGPTAAASDAGAPGAVAHQSVAMPGAPQGTNPADQQNGKKPQQQALPTAPAQTLPH